MLRQSYFTQTIRCCTVQYSIIFIARQHASARRARYCYGKSVRQSVRLSVCNTLVLYPNECTYRQTLFTVWEGHDPPSYRRYEIPRETRSAGA